MRQCSINESDRLALEAILYAYSCDKITANQCQRQCRLYGYAPDLMSSPESHMVEVLNLTSKTWHWITT